MHSKEILKEILVNEYLNKFLTFYISRTSSIYDEEDLSQLKLYLKVFQIT